VKIASSTTVVRADTVRQNRALPIDSHQPP